MYYNYIELKQDRKGAWNFRVDETVTWEREDLETFPIIGNFNSVFVYVSKSESIEVWKQKLICHVKDQLEQQVTSLQSSIDKLETIRK